MEFSQPHGVHKILLFFISTDGWWFSLQMNSFLSQVPLPMVDPSDSSMCGIREGDVEEQCEVHSVWTSHRYAGRYRE